jgi:anti-sigma factor RsiW
MHEKISALLDDELDGSDRREVLKLLGRDEKLAVVWQRYHLIRAGLRNEPIVHIPGFSERLERRLLDEAVVAAPAARPAIGGRRPWLPGLAVAASLAAVMALGLLTGVLDDPPSPAGSAEVALVDQDMRWETATPELEHDLNAFLVEHGEFSQMSGMNGLMAYAKFVSYDSSR